MNKPQSSGHPFRFGPYEFRPERGELRKSGVSLKLQPQPARLLELLVRRAGEIVTREEIQDAVWRDDIQVDFELGVNRCIRQVRAVLLDDPEKPTYVRTIPRHGYTFIARVETVARDVEPLGLPAVDQPSLPVVAPTPPEAALNERGTSADLAAPALIVRRRFLIAIALGLTLVTVLVAVVFRTRRSPVVYDPIPLTTYQGRQNSPSFSPDGRSVVYAWSESSKQHFRIFTEKIGSSKPVAITSPDSNSYDPVWSPSDEFIAFLRDKDDQSGELWLYSFADKREWKLRDLERIYRPEERQLSWTVDSKGLIVPLDTSSSRSGGLYYIPIHPGRDVQLTSSLPGQGDTSSAVSPDGRLLVFTRFFSSGVSHLCRLRLSGDHRPEGDESCGLWAGFDNVSTADPSFVGTDLLFISNRSGSNRVWRSPGATQTPQLVALPSGALSDLTFSQEGHRLAYTVNRSDSNVWRIDAAGVLTGHGEQPEEVIASTQMDQRAQVSPDRGRLAYESNRSGLTEIWTYDLKSHNTLQITHLDHLGTGSPSWSPDGKEIAFDARVEGRANIYRVSAGGGPPSRLTHNVGSNILPAWSADGQSIYFCSNRSGTPQIWRMPAHGGAAVQITSDGAAAAALSPDGEFMYYTKNFGRPSLWRLRLKSGGNEKLADVAEPRAFAIAPGGVWYLKRAETGALQLAYLDMETRKTRNLYTFTRQVISPLSFDGRCFLYFSQFDQMASNIMLVEDVR